MPCFTSKKQRQNDQSNSRSMPGIHVCYYKHACDMSPGRDVSVPWCMHQGQHENRGECKYKYDPRAPFHP